MRADQAARDWPDSLHRPAGGALEAIRSDIHREAVNMIDESLAEHDIAVVGVAGPVEGGMHTLGLCVSPSNVPALPPTVLAHSCAGPQRHQRVDDRGFGVGGWHTL